MTPTKYYFQIAAVNLPLLTQELVAAFPGIDLACVCSGTEAVVTIDDSIPEPSVAGVLVAHDPLGLTATQQIQVDLETNVDDMIQRFIASELKGKTPAQIYTMMQDRINGWTSLTQAQTDLADWLPLMAGGFAWLVMGANND